MTATILTAFRSHVLADPAVAALIGQRMSLATLPQKSQMPAVTFQPISAARFPTMKHDDNLPERRIQVNAFSPSADQAYEVAEAIRKLFHYYVPGPMGTPESIHVAGVFAGSDDVNFDPETKLYNVSRDYFIWAAEGG